MKFEPKTIDNTRSPYTGLTRESWIEAARYLLTGIFQNITDFQAPVIMPRAEEAITYPHKDAPAAEQIIQKKAELFEGLCRSFFLAAPLIHEDQDICICGYSLRNYYKNQVLRSCIPSDPHYVGNYHDLCRLADNTDPSRCFQQTVETCALVICLWLCKLEIWDTYTKAEKDLIATLLSDYAHAPTVPQNWRLFTMLDLTFLHMEGYPIDQEIMADHAQAILNYYAGDGWYRDGQCFDYYSCWAFQVYAPLWNLWYGYENEPYIASRFEEHSNTLMRTYKDFFDRDGFTNMWGRSNIYRNAATAAFVGNFFLKHPTADPGLSRRISSGSLMQFLGREDLLVNGIPSLGFYGQFAPLVQGYSCAESPFWLGKAFLCLYLDKDHPFWTATEHNGSWEKLAEREVGETVLNGPALCFTNHCANGETILRTGKVCKGKGDLHSMWNYSKLSYNSKYPWEASPSSADGKIQAQQYVLTDHAVGIPFYANVTFWHGQREGILYRRQFFDYSLEAEMHWFHAMDLADFPVANGILRLDRLRIFRAPITLTLGSYGFPDNGTEIIEKSYGNAHAIILKGTDATKTPKQMAMTIYDGWEALQITDSRKSNPDSDASLILYATTTRYKQYGGAEQYLLISQVITKESHEDFTEDELFPIKEILYQDRFQTGACGTTTLFLKDGSVKQIHFEGIEGTLSI